MAGFRGKQFGSSIDLPVTGDYNCDLIDDVAIFRPTTPYVYISPSPSGNTPFVPVFEAGDIAVRMDYDHDGYRDGTFNRNTRKWTIGSLLHRTVIFGLSTDRLVPADYNGDACEDIGIYRDGVWWFTTLRGNQAVMWDKVASLVSHLMSRYRPITMEI